MVSRNFVESGNRVVGIAAVWKDEADRSEGCVLTVGSEFVNLTEAQAEALGRYLLFQEE